MQRLKGKTIIQMVMRVISGFGDRLVMHNKIILRCLPLLASILGDKYGIEVTINGNTAFTDGSRINLPVLPLECDDTLLCLIRGYIDHEAAHIRFTDFNLVKNEIHSISLLYLFNIIEDWRVEKNMSEQFSGCKANLLWLSSYLFQDITRLNKDYLVGIWLLYTVRSWLLPSLEVHALQFEQDLACEFSEMVQQIKPILERIKDDCKDSSMSLNYAKELASIIKQSCEIIIPSYIEQRQYSTESDTSEDTQDCPSNNDATCAEQDEDGELGTDDYGNDFSEINDTEGENTSNESSIEHGQLSESSNAEDDSSRMGNTHTHSYAHKTIGSDTRPSWNKGVDISDFARASINQLSIVNRENKKPCRIAELGFAPTRPLSYDEFRQTKTIAINTKNRLQGLLQAKSLQASLPSKNGKLNTRHLYKLATHETKIFLKNTHKKANNTAIHILVDTSISMNEIINDVSLTCYTIAAALHEIQGINLAVTTFPAENFNTTVGYDDENYRAAVYPVIKHGERLHQNFKFTSAGGTPMTESLWWAIVQIFKQKEPRKIILLLTDGMPNDEVSTLQTLDIAKQIGVEVYGIAIHTSSIEKLMPNTSVNIVDIGQLPQAMFDLLKSVFLSG